MIVAEPEQFLKTIDEVPFPRMGEFGRRASRAFNPFNRENGCKPVAGIVLRARNPTRSPVL
jgi:hypothetical protein